MSAPKPPTPQPGVYATYVRGRHPQHKVHAKKGPALAAIYLSVYSWPRGGTLFQLIDGEWKELIEVAPPYHCAECGKEFGYVDRHGLGKRQESIYSAGRGAKKSEMWEDDGLTKKLYHYECSPGYKRVAEARRQKKINDAKATLVKYGES